MNPAPGIAPGSAPRSAEPMESLTTIGSDARQLASGSSGGLDLRGIIDDAIGILDPAQRRFFHDQSRVQVVNWHRQKGKDFTTAAKATAQAMGDGQTWYIVSLTQRQADETFDKCKWWAERWRVGFEEAARTFTEADADLGGEFVYKAREMKLPNGGRVVSLPGRSPDALAGFTGNVIFTEFGLFPGGGYDHWRVVFPLTTRGFRVIVISTPRGRNTRFYELVHAPELYSVHTCDIEKSVAEGYVLRDAEGEPTDLQTFRGLYGDEAGWRREYLCEFSGDLDALISWAKLTTAGDLGRGMSFDLIEITGGEGGRGESGWEPGIFRRLLEAEPGHFPAAARLEIGWDVARKRDLSALWVNLDRGDGFKWLRFLVLMRRVPFELQRAVVVEAMTGPRPAVGCGDATGIGMDSNETLRNRFGQRWEPVDFGGKRKSELGSVLATTFDDRGQAIPPIDGPYKFIAADLYAIHREDLGTDGAGERRLRLVENDNPLLAESHCDIAYAGALALRAGTLKHAVPGVRWI